MQPAEVALVCHGAVQSRRGLGLIICFSDVFGFPVSFASPGVFGAFRAFEPSRLEVGAALEPGASAVWRGGASL